MTNTVTEYPPFKYKGKIDYSKRKSFLSRKIVNYFQEIRHEDFTCFGEILDKYCEIGMSKLYVKKVMEELTGGTIKIRPNTIDEAIKVEMAQNRTKFYFHARTKNNPFHLNRGLIRKTAGTTHLSTQSVQFACLECKHQFTNEIHVTKKGFIGLRKRICPKCSRQSTLAASFVFQDKKVYKMIIDRKERFVTEEKSEFGA
jgi:transcription elongation factor Elf1